MRAVVPSEIANRYDIDDGDTLMWEDDGQGTVKVHPPEKE